MKIPMRATKAFAYAGRRLAVGQEFEAHGRSDARVLTAIGNAAEFKPLPGPKAGTYQTRVMTAATPAAAPVAPAELPMVIKIDGADMVLNDMEADALHALAERVGVKVHHLAGAKKVRQALIDSQKSAE